MNINIIEDTGINIIREGDKDRLDPIYRFHCYKCGCIWECHRSKCKKHKPTETAHLIYSGAFLDKLYQYKCPCCKAVTIGEDVHDIELRTCYRG